MLTIKDFIAYIKKSGIQRNNRFVISMNIPDAVLAKFNSLGDEIDLITDNSAITSIEASKAIALMAVDVSTPGQNLQTSELKAGVSRKVVDGRNTGELNITFRCSSKMTERKLFDAWMSLIYRDNGTVAYYDEYTSPGVDIFSLTNNGGQTYRVSMEEAYPVTLTELPFNSEQENGFLMFQVTFNYRRLHNTELESSTSSPPQSFVSSPTNAVLSATSLPAPPPTNNLPAMIFGIYKNIDRIKFAIENGSLSKEMGAKLILNLMRDLNGSGLDTGVSNTALKYANNLLFVLGRK